MACGAISEISPSPISERVGVRVAGPHPAPYRATFSRREKGCLATRNRRVRIKRFQWLAAPCQALLFLSQFQRVRSRTVSCADPCRSAVATFVLRASLPRFGAVGGHSEWISRARQRSRGHLDPKTIGSSRRGLRRPRLSPSRKQRSLDDRVASAVKSILSGHSISCYRSSITERWDGPETLRRTQRSIGWDCEERPIRSV
jgi:hypothetical protein